jgi:hypothetical protein
LLAINEQEKAAGLQSVSLLLGERGDMKKYVEALYLRLEDEDKIRKMKNH